MKLLFLSQYFPPEMGAPQARISELGIRLVKKGHQVTVITAMPNYPQGRIFDEYRGKIFVSEHYNGIKVLRSWIYPTKSINVLKRIICYFSFVISSAFMGTFVGKQDILVVESPPLFLGLSGIYLSFILKAKMIFNVSDLWPDSAIELGVISNKIFIALARGIEKTCYRFSSVITGQSPTIVEKIIQRTKSKKIELITNGVDTERFSPVLRRKEIKNRFGLENKFVVVYAGLFGIAQGIGQILDAAKLLMENRGIFFLLIGDGPEKGSLINRIEHEKISNVKIVSSVSRDEIPPILASMDLAIITLKKEITGAVPSKIYEAMASGLPIIFVGYGDGATIVTNSAIGVVVKPGEIADIVKYIRYLHDNPLLLKSMAEKGVNLAHASFSRNRIAEKLEEIIFDTLKI